jgi:hypothetical protein
VTHLTEILKQCWIPYGSTKDRQRSTEQ